MMSILKWVTSLFNKVGQWGDNHKGLLFGATLGILVGAAISYFFIPFTMPLFAATGHYVEQFLRGVYERIKPIINFMTWIYDSFAQNKNVDVDPEFKNPNVIVGLEQNDLNDYSDQRAFDIMDGIMNFFFSLAGGPKRNADAAPEHANESAEGSEKNLDIAAEDQFPSMIVGLDLNDLNDAESSDDTKPSDEAFNVQKPVASILLSGSLNPRQLTPEEEEEAQVQFELDYEPPVYNFGSF